MGWLGEKERDVLDGDIKGRWRERDMLMDEGESAEMEGWRIVRLFNVIGSQAV